MKKKIKVLAIIVLGIGAAANLGAQEQPNPNANGQVRPLTPAEQQRERLMEETIALLRTEGAKICARNQCPPESREAKIEALIQDFKDRFERLRRPRVAISTIIELAFDEALRAFADEHSIDTTMNQ